MFDTAYSSRTGFRMDFYYRRHPILDRDPNPRNHNSKQGALRALAVAWDITHVGSDDNSSARQCLHAHAAASD